MARAKEASSAAAIVPQNDNAQIMSASDAAADLAVWDDFELATDGLDEAGESDFRLPIIVWNVKGKDEKTGDMRRIDHFYDTMNEVSLPALRCVMLHLHKTNAFARFDNNANKNILHCSSHDRLMGTLRTKHPDRPDLQAGLQRECASCSDKDWYKDDKGKNVRNCDDVYGIFCIHLDPSGQPTEKFLLRFKRTALPPLIKHLNQHHLGRRPMAGGKRGNVPLFAFPIQLTLETSKNGNYAVPVFERGPQFGRDVLVQLADEAKYVKEIGEEATRAAEKAEERHEAASDLSGGSSGQPDASDFTA